MKSHSVRLSQFEQDIMQPDIEAILKHYSVTIETPVAWGEMDAFQHVNNIVYFRYFESARIAYLEKIGYLEFMEKTGFGPILASTKSKFKIPLAYPDKVTICGKASSIDSDRFIMDYGVISHKHQKIAAEGEGLIVSYDYKAAKKVPIPEEIKERILKLEGF